MIWLDHISANGYVGGLGTRVDADEHHRLRDKVYDLVEEYHRKINPLTFNIFRAREQGQAGLLKGRRISSGQVINVIQTRVFFSRG